MAPHGRNPLGGLTATAILGGIALSQETTRQLGELIDALRDPDQRVAAQIELATRTDAIEELGKFVLYSRQSAATHAALQILLEAGPRAVPALPHLVESLRDRYVPEDMIGAIASAVGRIGMYAGTDRVNLLDDLSRGRIVLRHDARTHVDDLFTRLEVDGSGAWRDVRPLLRSDHPIEVAAACEVLLDRHEDLAGFAKPVSQELVAFLERGARTRVWLIQLPPREMRALLTRASEALIPYDADDPNTWLGWCQRLFHFDPARRVEAAHALASLRQPDALPWLLQAMRGPNEVALAALHAIVRHGPAASHVAPELRRLLVDLESAARVEAEQLVRVLEPSPTMTEHAGPPVEFLGVGVPDAALLASETARLQQWLDARRGENRSRVQREPVFIEEYSRGAVKGSEPEVRWIPVKVLPDAGDPWRWEDAEASHTPGAVLVTEPGAVGRNRERGARVPWLVYLLPVPVDRPAFSGRIEASSWRERVSFRITEEDAAAWQAMIADVAFEGGSEAYLIDGLVFHVQPLRGKFSTSRRGPSVPVQDPNRDWLLLERIWELVRASSRRGQDW